MQNLLHFSLPCATPHHTHSWPYRNIKSTFMTAVKLPWNICVYIAKSQWENQKETTSIKLCFIQESLARSDSPSTQEHEPGSPHTHEDAFRETTCAKLKVVQNCRSTNWQWCSLVGFASVSVSSSSLQADNRKGIRQKEIDMRMYDLQVFTKR